MGRPRKAVTIDADAEEVSSGEEALLPIEEDVSSSATPTTKKAFKEKKIGKKRFSKQDIDSYSRQLKGWHEAAALILKEPSLNITETEAIELTTALSVVVEEYGMVVDPKISALIQLIGVAGVIYIPKAIHVKRNLDARSKGVKEVKAPANPGEPKPWDN